LATVQDLHQESATIEQLQKQLGDLAKPKGWFQSMKDMAAFGQKVKAEYDRLLCEESKSEEKELKTAIADIDGKLKAAGADTVSLNAEKTQLQVRLGQAQARKQGLDGCK